MGDADISLVTVSGVAIRTLFSPYDDTTGEFLKFVQSAQKSIQMMIFSLTMPELVDALIEKQQQGVQVQILMDYEQASGRYAQPQVGRLLAHQIDLVVGTSPIIAGAPQAHLHSGRATNDPIGEVLHTKATIVDGEWVADGSWNYSHSAPLECNTINFVQSEERAAAFLAQFNLLRSWILQNQPHLQPRHGTAVDSPVAQAAVSLAEKWANEGFQTGTGASFANLTLTTLFAPYHDLEGAFLEFLGRAEQSIHIMIYELRTQAIVDRLIAKQKAGVQVQLVLDRRAYEDNKAAIPEGPLVDALQQNGVDVVIGTSPCDEIMHTKATVVDGDWVWDGSWNYTPTADREANPVNIVQSAQRAGVFLQQFQQLRDYMVNRSGR